MSKLVDKEKLARLAKALDDRAKAAVQAEKERAMGVETAQAARILKNEQDIAAINNADTGILKQAQNFANTQDAALKEELEGQINTVDGRVDKIVADMGSFFEGDKEGTQLSTLKASIATNAAAIAVLNGDENEEKSVKAQIKAATDAQALVDAGLIARIAANEAHVTAQPGVDAEQDRRIKALEDANAEGGAMAEAVQSAQAAADAAQADVDALEAFVKGVPAAEGQEKVNGLVDRVAANEEAIELLNGTADGSVSKAVADAIAQEVSDRNAAIDVEKQRAEGEEGKIRQELANAIGVAAAEGQEASGLRKEIADAVKAEKDRAEGVEAAIRGEFAAADAQVLADAKKHADDAITALVDSAPDAMNTLNELAKAINDNKDIYDAYVEEHATAMAALKTELQAEIDADVKVVADELAKQKDADVDGTLANQIKVEKARAEEQEEILNQAIADEAVTARAAEKALGERIDAVEEVDNAQNNRLNALEELVGLGGEEGEDGNQAPTVIGQLQTDVVAAQGAADAAQAAADRAQADVDAVEELLNGKEAAEGQDAVKGLIDRVADLEADLGEDGATAEAIAQNAADIKVLQGFKEAHSHEAMEKDIEDLQDAVAKEVEDRDNAIATALEAYSTTEEVKGILTNVVASLALTMENDKVVLKLGGVDGVALSEVSLVLATTDDIDAIIAGLDEEVGNEEAGAEE